MKNQRFYFSAYKPIRGWLNDNQQRTSTITTRQSDLCHRSDGSVSAKILETGLMSPFRQY